ncbi:MAG TPA: MBL fold metallo-hydrolase, partial [Burkholderiales bacterium]
MKLSFLGAAGEVTGSSYLVETASCRFLVDCGMFQGGRDADRKNLAALNFDVRTLDFVLLTHAHLDHSGLLPRLISFGYRGPVYTSTATAALLPTMLKDSAHIHEKEAVWETARRRARRGRDALPVRDVAPLYTAAQAEACA